MFSSESVVMNTESVVAENKEADTNNDRMVLEDEDDSDHHNISNEDTDMTSDTPIIDSIVDIFAKTIDLNNQHLHTISNSSIKVRGSKKAHSKTEKHIFNKVGAKLRLKPITTIKSLKYRPLRRSTHKKHSKVSISNYDI